MRQEIITFLFVQITNSVILLGHLKSGLLTKSAGLNVNVIGRLVGQNLTIFLVLNRHFFRSLELLFVDQF